MRIIKNPENYLEVTINEEKSEVEITVADFSGTLDNPWRSASITLTREEWRIVRTTFVSSDELRES